MVVTDHMLHIVFNLMQVNCGDVVIGNNAYTTGTRLKWFAFPGSFISVELTTEFIRNKKLQG